AESRRRAVGDLRCPLEVPGGVDPAAAVHRRRTVVDSMRGSRPGMEPTPALRAETPPPRPERRERHARKPRSVVSLHDEPGAPTLHRVDVVRGPAPALGEAQLGTGSSAGASGSRSRVVRSAGSSRGTGSSRGSISYW